MPTKRQKVSPGKLFLVAPDHPVPSICKTGKAISTEAASRHNDPGAVGGRQDGATDCLYCHRHRPCLCLCLCLCPEHGSARIKAVRAHRFERVLHLEAPVKMGRIALVLGISRGSTHSSDPTGGKDLGELICK